MADFNSDAAFRDDVHHFLSNALPDELRAAGRRCSGIFIDNADGTASWCSAVGVCRTAGAAWHHRLDADATLPLCK
jgi:hypothetical protein